MKTLKIITIITLLILVNVGIYRVNKAISDDAIQNILKAVVYFIGVIIVVFTAIAIYTFGQWSAVLGLDKLSKSLHRTAEITSEGNSNIANAIANQKSQNNTTNFTIEGGQQGQGSFADAQIDTDKVKQLPGRIA